MDARQITRDLIYNRFRCFPVNKLARAIETSTGRNPHAAHVCMVINHKKKTPWVREALGQIVGLPVEILFPESDEILHIKQEKRKKQ